MEVSATLRRWFAVDAVVGIVAGAPLLLFPGGLLGALGWTTIDPATARLAGAALLAMGLQTHFARHGGLDVYRNLLNLKMIFSAGAALGLFLAVGDGAPAAAWAFLSLYTGLCGIWTHYRIRMKQMAAAADLPDDELEPAP